MTEFCLYDLAEMTTYRGEISTPDLTVCIHCGDPIRGEPVLVEGKPFCCNGCRVVYDILSQAESCPVPAPKPVNSSRFEYLDDPSVVSRIRDFSDGTVSTLTFSVPRMHCSSCVWLLENLYRFDQGILYSRADFLRKTINVRYADAKTSLRKVVELLTGLGYEPELTLESVKKPEPRRPDHSLYAKIGIAGFCFGNIMILSFPEYLSAGEVEPGLRSLFTYVSLALSLPVLLYSSTGYFRSAISGLSRRVVNIDVPIALGIAILFIRSAVDILSETGSGYLDSMTGLVFFLLIGRLFQNRTYDSLNFERTYTSYFPLAVTTRRTGAESTVPVTSLHPGDRMLIRNDEIVPADAVLISAHASIDYSFVTGESRTVACASGDLVHAGGRLRGAAIELEVAKTVSQSYLTQLWNDAAFHADHVGKLSRLSNAVGKYFTAGIFLVATATGAYWFPRDVATAWIAVTAVLIVACPCALALATPFAFGTALRVFGKGKLYAKNADVAEHMSRIDTVVLDKTGTLTSAHDAALSFAGDPLSMTERRAIRSLVRNSHHPLSRAVYDGLRCDDTVPVGSYEEFPGEGILGIVGTDSIRVGSREFTASPAAPEHVSVPGREGTNEAGTEGGPDAPSFERDRSGEGDVALPPQEPSLRVFVSINGIPRGCFIVSGSYREGVSALMGRLQKRYDVMLLSGDSDHEREALKQRFGESVPMHFNQSPADKLSFIAALQQRGKAVLMVGDGLNDAGALKQADVGVALTDDTTAFTPACDAILDGSRLTRLDEFLKFARSSRTVVLLAYAISVLYNVIGLSFAVRGALSPVIAAILMPVSSITVVAFTSLTLQALARKRDLL
ncbi:MAG: HAD-IC family P-type ATPase [Bacteroidetes bacterium]|nr:HAD-IC family P-type ATPase [Bacteroidota bacterium]